MGAARRHRRTLVASALALGGLVVGGARATAQGNLSTQGFGYPPGQLSSSALALGGATGEFDSESPLNPASIAGVTRATIHIQYDPEFRTVSTPLGSDGTTTIRFPLLSATLPLSPKLVLGLSFSTLLDRTWESTQTGPTAVGDTMISSTETFKSTGGIEDLQLAGGWAPTGWLHAGLGLHVYTGQNQIAVERMFPDTTVVKALPFTENGTYSYTGTGVSAGVELRPSPNFAVAGSFGIGGTLRVRRNDTLQSKANVPPRAGAGIRYDGLPGVTFAARAEWEGWSQMSGLGESGFQAHNAWDFGGGVEVVGPRLGGDHGLLLRFGGQTRTLPFLANSALVRENDISGGLGIPLGGTRGALDLSVQRALRSAPVGVSEAAWVLSVGLTVRP